MYSVESVVVSFHYITYISVPFSGHALAEVDRQVNIHFYFHPSLFEQLVDVQLQLVIWPQF